MKKLFFPAIAMILIAMASCTAPPPPPAAIIAVDTVGDRNIEIVKKYREALFTGNVTAAADFLADNFMGRGPALKDSTDRIQLIDTWTKRWADEFSSMKYDETAVLATTVKEGINAGDWVLNWGTMTVEYKDGKPPVKFMIQLSSRVSNGKIAFNVAYYNVADILTQQGFTFTPPGAKGTKK